MLGARQQQIHGVPDQRAIPAVTRGFRRTHALSERRRHLAMVMLGRTNSRMKDYFDIAYLASLFPFEASRC